MYLVEFKGRLEKDMEIEGLIWVILVWFLWLLLVRLGLENRKFDVIEIFY